MFRHLCLFIVIVFAAAAQAEPQPQVEPNVISVQTVGHWLSDGTAGRYKIIVTTEGWEHLWSRVYVEWLPDPANPNAEWKSVAIAELVPPVAPGHMVLKAAAEESKAGHLLITVHATPNQDLSEVGVKSAVYRYEATTPGNVRLLNARPQ